MTKEQETFNITCEQRDLLLQDFKQLLKEKVSLQQALREQKEISESANEELFLELLEVIDALDFLLNYLGTSAEMIPPSWKSLPKSVNSVQKKLLSILERRQVIPIDFQESKPDFSLCRVVEREIRDDLEEQTIIKIIRRGFRLGHKLLRPVEAIIAGSSKNQN